MKILVIGGAGYIGSHVVRELIDKKFTVTVFDNLSTGTMDNVFNDTEFIKGDILNVEDLKNAMKNGFDGIFHFAAFKAAGESMINPQKYSINNINGTLNILNTATEYGIDKFIFSSSAAVYGDPSYLPIDEAHPTNPLNYYGFTKLEIERFLYWYDMLCNIKFAALRYFNAAGYDIHNRISGLERNPQNLLPCVMEAAIGIRKQLTIYGNDYDTPDGTGVRDYIHVNDLATAHVKAFDYLAENRKSCICNLGSETGISVQTVIDTAREITGKQIPAIISGRREGDSACLYASSKYAEKLLNWKAEHSDIRTLIETTWNVYAKQSR
jgi:UDP-glucose 4-epimerase